MPHPSLTLAIMAITSVFTCRSASAASASPMTCADIEKTFNLPCATVFPCGKTAGSAAITMLSSGSATARSNSLVKICYIDKGLVISTQHNKQSFFSENGYNSCNDPIYNLDVSEIFIAPVLESQPDGPQCYNEIDVSPQNVMFESGIYNPNLNHASIKGTLINCNTSLVEHTTEIDKEKNIWISTLTLPWAIANNPSGCPVVEYSQVDPNSPTAMYRINFYRINELVPVSQCSSTGNTARSIGFYSLTSLILCLFPLHCSVVTSSRLVVPHHTSLPRMSPHSPRLATISSLRVYGVEPHAMHTASFP